VILARLAGCPGTLQILDIRNYGIEEWPAALPLGQRAEWLRYVMASMVDILRDNELGSLQVTSGSQALYTLRRKYLTHTIHCHANEPALELERAAYVGGRCECRRIGAIDGLAYHVDYRSLYPSLCVDGALPAVFVRMVDEPGLQYSDIDTSKYCCIADVTISTDEPAYPYRRGSEVIYPVGRFRAQLAGPELEDAWRRMRLVALHRYALYYPAPALDAYARGLYAILETERRRGNIPIVEWLKRLLVCIVGKMGQHGSVWRTYPDCDPPDAWFAWYVHDDKHGLCRARSLGWEGQIEIKEGFAPNTCPAIAAWICSAGRVKLLDAIRCAGWDNVYYYDTDSLLCSETGYARLRDAGRIHDGVLGHLRVIGGPERAECYGIKHYRFGDEYKCAGSPRGTTEVGPDDSHFWYREWLKKAITGKHAPKVERVLRSYQREATYRHGVVGSDGRVSPIRIEE
jgi:hypothetical protein